MVAEKRNVFCMHADCNEVEPDTLYDVRVPQATKSWTPLGHGQVRTAMVSAIEDAGLTIASERWALSDKSKKPAGRFKADPNDTDIIHQDGNRCFGLIELARHGDDDFRMSIGIQNSLDKTMALRRLLAAVVMVCDNLVLATLDGAEGVVTVRKHTSMIDLAHECRRTVDSAIEGFTPFRGFIDSLKAAPCNDKNIDSIVCRSIEAGIMPNSAAGDMLAAWYDRQAPKSTDKVDWDGFADRLTSGFYEARNGWTAHGIWTDCIGRRISPVAVGNRMIESQAAFNTIVTEELALAN